jgi:hypothetical protein
MTITFLICVAIAAYWFLSRNNKKNKPDEEDSYDGPKMARQAEKDYTSRWSSNFDVTDEQYKLISNTENIYKSAAETDYKTYEEPLIENKRIQKILEWAKNKKSKNKKNNLIDFINNNLDLITPEISVNLYFDLMNDGGFFCEEFNAYGFQINRSKSPRRFEFDNETWVNLLTEPYLYDWTNFSVWFNDESIWDADNYLRGDKTYYLRENCAEFVPLQKNAEYWWEVETLGLNLDELVKIELADEISFKNEIFLINEEEFMFSKKEKDHLITLLMASYKPSLLKTIMEAIDNTIDKSLGIT